VKRRPRIGRG